MALSKKKRAALKQMYGGKCAYCGEVLGERWHADHVEPVLRKLSVSVVDHQLVYKTTGEFHRPDNNRDDNYAPACVSCNLYKSSMDVETFRKVIETSYLNAINRTMTLRAAQRFGILNVNPKKIVFWFEVYNAQNTPDTVGEADTDSGSSSGEIEVLP